MRTLFGAVIVCALLVAALSCPAEPAKGVTFSSEKPRYAKVALTEDGAKILCVVFDESKGTGKGCDVLYADTNFNGVFEGGEKLTPTVEKCSSGFHCNYPGIKLDIAYNEKAKGIANPCEVSFIYAWHSSPIQPTTRILGVTLPGPPAPKTVTESFYGSVTVRLPGEAQQQWEYSSNSSDLKPAESIETAPLMGLAGTPKLMIATQPDGRQEGNFGVALTVVSVRRVPTESAGQSAAKEPASCVDLGLTEAEVPMQVKMGASAPKAHVEIKTPDGKVVHKGDETLDKFVFG